MVCVDETMMMIKPSRLVAKSGRVIKLPSSYYHYYIIFGYYFNVLIIVELIYYCRQARGDFIKCVQRTRRHEIVGECLSVNGSYRCDKSYKRSRSSMLVNICIYAKSTSMQQWKFLVKSFLIRNHWQSRSKLAEHLNAYWKSINTVAIIAVFYL